MAAFGGSDRKGANVKGGEGLLGGLELRAEDGEQQRCTTCTACIDRRPLNHMHRARAYVACVAPASPQRKQTGGGGGILVSFVTSFGFGRSSCHV